MVKAHWVKYKPAASVAVGSLPGRLLIGVKDMEDIDGSGIIWIRWQINQEDGAHIIMRWIKRSGLLIPMEW